MIEFAKVSGASGATPSLGPGALVERHGRDGRPKIYPASEYGKDKPKGEYYTRTTTFIDALEDKTNLVRWKQRNVLVGALRRPDILEELGSIEDPQGADKGAVDKLVGIAEEAADADLRALKGSAIHLITEDLDHGKGMPFVPDEFRRDIEAYLEAMKQAEAEILGIEQFCVLDQYKVAGTFDRLVRYKGKLMIADIKTGRIDYGLGKIAMQLAAYRHMEVYDPVTYQRSPLLIDGEEPDADEALIIHLPSGEGKCDIVPVDIRKGWEGLAVCSEVREWRRHWNRKASRREPVVSVTVA